MYNNFTFENIKDKNSLHQLVEIEANNIWAHEPNRRGRTYDQVYNSTLQGKIAEQWLLENHNFTRATVKYHDLVNEIGELVEVKSFSYGDIYSRFVKESVEKYKTATWNYSKWYILFNCTNGTYSHMATIRLK
jgi:hypothetical protein